MEGLIVLVIFAILVLVIVAKTAIVVPQQSAYVVERLGRYAGTLDAGFHILVPFIDVVRYKHSLKENAIDIPAQVCITRDNVQVGVDGVLYLKIMNPHRASYGVTDYAFAITQLDIVMEHRSRSATVVRQLPRHRDASAAYRPAGPAAWETARRASAFRPPVPVR